MTEQKRIAAYVTRYIWEGRRAEAIDFLTTEYRSKTGQGPFSRKGADRAFHSFIETMIFVAEETGVPQLGAQP